MGLDIVELVMEVEEEFEISILDEDAERIRTIGHLVDYVWGLLGARQPAFCLSSRYFYRVRRALMSHLPLSRRQVRPDSPFVNLIPRERRGEVWDGMIAGGLRLPRRGAYLSDFIDACLDRCLGTSIAEAHLPLRTVREAVHYLTPLQRRPGPPSPIWTSRRQVAERVREIVCENLGVNYDQATEDARFHEDLGAS